MLFNAGISDVSRTTKEAIFSKRDNAKPLQARLLLSLRNPEASKPPYVRVTNLQ